ncbi:hypothetical protein C0995_009556 [Termitomyces sp. Mi166|nr:hypothetical protein C0995_009556 [Termitomyces sp. Mi166\
MASHLANIFGTEQDRVNCSFYYKLTEKELQEGFDAVYEDLYCELAKFGHLLELHVCDNVGDHLIGNVYARYEWETEAQAAVDSCNERWYAGM